MDSVTGKRKIGDPPSKWTSLIIYWALFDFANSILITNGGLYFPQWITTKLGSPASYNIVLSLSSIIVLVTAPLRQWSSILLWTASTIMAIAGFALFFIGRMAKAQSALLPIIALVLFLIINVSYQWSRFIYNGLLGRFRLDANVNRVSAIGFAAGWAGAIFGVLLLSPIASGRVTLFSNPIPRVDYLLPATVLYLCLTIVSLRGVRPLTRSLSLDMNFVKRQTEHFPRTRHSLTIILLIYGLISAAALSVEANMSLYLETVVGISDSLKALYIASFLFIAGIGAVIAGWLCPKVLPIKLLAAVIGGWIFMMLVMASSSSKTLFTFSFLMLGMLFGAIWTLMRALYAATIPAETGGWFFGLYASVERTAAIAGPLIWALTVTQLGNGNPVAYRWSIAIMTLPLCAALILAIRLSGSRSGASNGGQ
jgi:MFS transporter, UMF1 family